jgi:hypothetical protein
MYHDYGRKHYNDINIYIYTYVYAYLSVDEYKNDSALSTDSISNKQVITT